VTQASIWWNCHDKLFLQMHGTVKEFSCPALTVLQATVVAQTIAQSNIRGPLSIFEMVELEQEIDKLDLSDLVF